MERSSKKSMKNLSFIERACGSDEKLILGAHIHWIYLVKGACWMLVFFALGYGMTWMADKVANVTTTPYTLAISRLIYMIGHHGQLVCAFIGVTIFLCYYVVYDTTRIGLTTRRLILRKGLIFVKLIEIDLEEIKGESVDHGMLGRFLDYGELVLDARFIKDFSLPSISDPYRLLRAIHEVRAQVGDTIGNAANMAPPPPQPPAPQPAPAYPPVTEGPRAGGALPAPFIDAEVVEILDETDEHVIYKRSKTQPA